METFTSLREDVKIHPAPSNQGGQPCWLLEDPVRNQFFHIDWPTYEILSRWDYGAVDFIVESINSETTLIVSAKDVEEVAKFIDTHCLVKRSSTDAASGLNERRINAKKSTLHKLMHSYLFFRVPIVNPDPWLNRLLPLGEFLLSRRFLVITLIALLVGIVQISRQWDVFLSTLVNTFTFEGLLYYGLALFFVKILHEFGHAFTAKKYGCKVPTMGIAFLVLFPMAYTDMNQVWKVTERGKRLEIAVAGIRLELLVAAWATFLWVLLPDGPMRSAVFFLATISWVLTLFLNASPFMRFDGYFILMDWINFPNLHSRSSAVARWRIRKFLFGVGEKCPEEVSVNFQRFLIIFAMTTWIYRFFLFIGIALLIYTKTTKIVGVTLAIVEIYWFILKPVIAELKDWWTRRQVLVATKRTKTTGIIFILLLLVFVLPLPIPVTTNAFMRPAEFTNIVLFNHAKLQMIHIAEQEKVTLGSQLFEFLSPAAEYQQILAEIQKNGAIEAFQAAGVSMAEDLSMTVITHNRLRAMANFDQAQEGASKFQLTALENGTFYFENPDLHSGQWLAKGQNLGTLVTPSQGAEIIAWIDETDVARIKIGSKVSFFSHRVGKPVLAEVVHIEDDASNNIPVPALTVAFGGTILVREHNGMLVPEQSLYKVTIRAEGYLPPGVHYGKVYISGSPITLGGRFLRSAILTIVRELTP